MPARSKKQQMIFGIALSIKRGKGRGSRAAQDIAEDTSEDKIEEFASVKRKSLPDKVTASRDLAKKMRRR